MNGLTPEDLEVLHNALSGTSTSEAVTLIFVGILALAGVIGVVLWILNTKLEPVKSMQEKLDTIATTVTEMKSSLWTEESLNRLIVFQLMQYLQAHEQNCPCRKLHNQGVISAPHTPIMNTMPPSMSTTQNIPTQG